MNTALQQRLDPAADLRQEKAEIQPWISQFGVTAWLREGEMPSEVSPDTSNKEVRSESRPDKTDPAAVIAFPKTLRPQPHSRPLQQWEGVILGVGTDSFTARLVDRTNPGTPDEEAEISLDEISPDDLALVAPGAIFYWSIAYETTVSGQRKRSSVIRLRRLPAWSTRDIEAAQSEAAELYKALLWE